MATQGETPLRGTTQSPPTTLPPQTGYSSATLPLPERADNLLTKQSVVFLVIGGVILFFLGMIVLCSMILVKPPTTPYGDEYQTYKDTLRTMAGSGRILVCLGGLLTCIGFFGSAIGNEKWDVKVRVGMISGGIAFIIAVLVMFSIFSSFPPM